MTAAGPRSLRVGQRGLRPGPRVGGLLLAALLLLPPVSAAAAIPSAGRVLEATADHNRKSGLARGLRLEVSLHFEDDSEPAARGALWMHPDGRVGLELRAGAGFVERHVLRGGRAYVSRDGVPVPEPRPFLPPLHLLQISDRNQLFGALRTLGVDPAQVVLGRDADHDCYVLGGRAAGAPSLWVDVQSLAPVGFARGDGVHWRVGPPTTFGELAVPSYVEVEHPGHRPVRLQVDGAAPAPIPEFDVPWLEAPASAASD